MSKPPSSSHQHDTHSRENSKTSTEMDDPEKAMVTISRLVEQLHSKKSSSSERELSTARLLGLVKGKRECRRAIAQNVHAMPSFISLLRDGSLVAKLNVASILNVLCKDENLRSKVLIGGCIPPLLSLLKSESVDAKKAASAALYEVSFCGMRDDNVGSKIFVTEGVVPSLWDQLKRKKNHDKTVEGHVLGALSNLCSDKEQFWTHTLEEGGVNVVLNLLQSKNAVSQSNAASLLARLVRVFNSSIPRIIESGTIKALLQLLGEENDIFVRASVIDALEAITSKSEEAKKVVRESDGIRLLIGAVVAPSKVSVDEEIGRDLQRHATQTLAYLCGGLSVLIVYLGQLSLSPRLAEPVADILGTLAYALRIFDPSSDHETFDPTQIEGILVNLLKPRDTKLIQERILEAMTSLYGNIKISVSLKNADEKRVLVGITILTTADLRERMITCLSQLCRQGDVWEAIGKREGIQMFIPFLGLSTEQHQEFSVEFLAILTDKVDESRWAITSAGGIPPLVQILKTGGVSHKARDDAVRILWNLCSHSEEIRVCVEKAGAIPAFLWLLKNGGPKSQETSAKALMKLVSTADSSVIEQVLALFLADTSKSKVHLTRVLGHVLASASLEDFVQKGSAANNGLRSLVQTLASSNDKMKENAASVLADLFNSRPDLCNCLGIDESENLGSKLLTGNTHAVATHLARALGSLSNPTKKKAPKKKQYPAESEVIKPIIKSAKISPIEIAENPISTLADLLSDPNIAAEALTEDVVSVLTRVLREGSLQGKRNASHALHQLLKHFQVGDVFKGNDQYRFAVPGLIDLLNATDVDVNNNTFIELLEVISLLAQAKYDVNPFSAFSDVPSSLDSLVRCVGEGHSLVQDKAIEILSRFCRTQHIRLGELLVTRLKSICSLANRVTNSPNPETRVGGAVLLICAVKNDKNLSVEALDRSGILKSLVSTLLDMATKQNFRGASYTIEVQRPRSFLHRSTGESEMFDPVSVPGSTIAIWLLSCICSCYPKNRLAVIEANGLEMISEKLQRYTSNITESAQETEGIWITTSLLAIIFQEPITVSSAATTQLVPTLARLMKSDQIIERYFTAQALVALVRNKNTRTNTEIANSYIVDGLINSVGYSNLDMKSLVALSEELCLEQNPCEVVLMELFEDEGIRGGSMAKKYIPILVDLLKPNANRPDAPPVAVRILTRISDKSDPNKVQMAKVGALDLLAKYLSLSPQDSTEIIVSELLGSLFRNLEITQHEAAISSMRQLIAVLHLGSRSSRYSAARALRELFKSEHIRDSESAWKAFPSLIDMLNTTSEMERETALGTLVTLTSGKVPKMDILNGFEGNPLKNVYQILSSNGSSLESKTTAAKLCYIIFGNDGFRTRSLATDCMESLISLIQSGINDSVEAGIVALDRLMDDKNSELAEGYECLNLCLGLVSDENYKIGEAAISCLIKMAKDKTSRKLDLVKSGIIDKALQQLSRSPLNSLCSIIAELFRILTNVGVVARSQSAIKMVQPLLSILLRPDLSLDGQLGGLQAITNILEKPNVLDSLDMASATIVTPMVPLLQSESLAVQHATIELLTRLLLERRFQEDIVTKDFIDPLVKLSGIRIRTLQEIALKGLQASSITWPKEVEEAGGILELSKVIADEDPQLPTQLWESVAFVLCNILRSNPEQYFFRVTLHVLSRMLFSTVESTVIVALNALIIREKFEASSVITMAESGAIDALLDLLRSHHCEDLSGRLVEMILNNPKVREMRICKFVMTPLSEYLLDQQTTSESAKLLVAVALGNLGQHEGLARATDSAFACRALISLLEDVSSQEIQMVAICALQNFVMHSRTNRKVVAEAGGIMLVQEMLMSCNPQVSAQAALMIKCLFSNHTLQEYMSQDLVKSLTAALEREFWTTATINAEVVRTLNVILTTFPKLRSSEATTMAIPHLIGALKSGDKEAREAALDTLYTLRQSWSSMSTETARSQAVLAAEAIPVLQMMMKSRPQGSFRQRGNSLLNCLPGTLVVSIHRGDNLKNSMGSTNPFCRLTIDNCPTKQTQVVRGSSSPVWKESFTWDFAVPPSGHFLHILCKTKNLFRNRTLGRVTIPVDKVLTEGTYSGTFSLGQDSSKDGPRRTLDVEIVWSNQMF
ncbi:PREDICTED: uncharacterized protein LOC104806830 [Tarenaya hassleriana]|uniref:uncharacterized protein LOC104806830 n=1 Tax=Tarenaya hassleriana TaxID=28532 RepID=UPI00053C323A|nr:PREDICTED: uncharacterized protein LOC104806830 [Tarenaya hassleriana]